MWSYLGITVLIFGYLHSANPGPACRISEFPCRNGRCISLNKYCDGIDDCEDISDEPKFCTGE
ncbi:hypothetical protein HHI36_013976, partial [Cryptolaemus montrouzieri]